MKAIWLFRLALLYAVLFFLGSLCSTILGALANASWHDMDGQGKFMLVVAIAGNVINTFLAFVSKEAKKLADGDNPVPNGTDLFKNPNPPPQAIAPPKP